LAPGREGTRKEGSARDGRAARRMRAPAPFATHGGWQCGRYINELCAFPFLDSRDRPPRSLRHFGWPTPAPRLENALAQRAEAFGTRTTARARPAPRERRGRGPRSSYCSTGLGGKCTQVSSVSRRAAASALAKGKPLVIDSTSGEMPGLVAPDRGSDWATQGIGVRVRCAGEWPGGVSLAEKGWSSTVIAGGATSGRRDGRKPIVELFGRK